MSERGVFAVDRGIFDHPTLSGEKYTKVQAFMWIVAEAAWKPHTRAVGSAVVALKRGQAACSLRFMAGKWGWEEPRVRRFLARLKTDAMIDAATDAGVTVITVCNYDVYQRVSLPSDAPYDAGIDAAATQQRRKVEDRETKETDTSLRSVSAKPRKAQKRVKTAIEETTQPTERQLQDARDEGMDIAEIRSEWRAFRDNCLKHALTYSDWPAAWRSWIRHPIRKERLSRLARGSPSQAPKPNTAGDRAAFLLSVINGGTDGPSEHDQPQHRIGRTIEHQGDGYPDRALPRPSGDGAGRLSEEGYRRFASPDR